MPGLTELIVITGLVLIPASIIVLFHLRRRGAMLMGCLITLVGHFVAASAQGEAFFSPSIAESIGMILGLIIAGVILGLVFYGIAGLCRKLTGIGE